MRNHVFSFIYSAKHVGGQQTDTQKQNDAHTETQHKTL